MNPYDNTLVVSSEHGRALQFPTQLFQALVLLVIVGFLYKQILSGLVVNWWADPNFSHGFFVPLFSLFIVWKNRKKLAEIPREPNWFGLVIISGALLVLIVGVLGAELFLSRSSLVLLVAGLIIYFAGWSYFRFLLFPWAVLFLMIPIPMIVYNQIVFPLQLLASRLATSLLTLVGVPVLREGNVLNLPTMALEVAEACSGIRSLISLVTLAVIYGYFAETRIFRRVILVAAAVPIAVAANGLRIMGTGLLGEYWNPDKAEGFFHSFSGWIIFMFSIGMLSILHGALNTLRRSPVKTSAGSR
jgi:exosortase